MSPRQRHMRSWRAATRRGPPPWWPSGDPWPPPALAAWGRRHRTRVLWRVGCLLAALVVLAGTVGTLLIGLTAAALGVIGITFLLRLAAAAALALGLLGVAGGVFWVRRLAAPVAELVVAARRIEAGDLSARVAEGGPREVRTVSRAFNSMSARLEATEARRRSFLADVTHELRTPLSVIRGQAEGIADGLYPGDAVHVAPILDAARNLEVLVEDLRTLALTESGSLVLAREPVDLALLVNETLESFRASAEGAGVELDEQIANGVTTVDADPARVRMVLANLLANAIRHTGRSGTVMVKAVQSGDMVEVSVRDSGEGIAAELLPRVFDRFVRGPGSRGSGLGLAIARDLVAAHGGTIVAESPPGRGTIIRFTLPARRAAQDETK